MLNDFQARFCSSAATPEYVHKTLFLDLSVDYVFPAKQGTCFEIDVPVTTPNGLILYFKCVSPIFTNLYGKFGNVLW